MICSAVSSISGFILLHRGLRAGSPIAHSAYRARPASERLQLVAGLFGEPWQKRLVRIELRLRKQEDVEREVDYCRAIRFGVLRVRGGRHTDAVLDGGEACARGRAIARRLPAFLMGP